MLKRFGASVSLGILRVNSDRLTILRRLYNERVSDTIAIKEECVEITIIPRSVRHYEALGYVIPRRHVGNKISVPRTKLNVNVSDLPLASDVRVTKVCDICGGEVLRQKYSAIMSARCGGKDRCSKCARGENARVGGVKMAETKCRHAATTEHNLAVLFPEIAAEWHSIKNGSLTAADFAPMSGRRAWWQCGKCGHEWNVTISQRTSSDTWCPVCNESKGEKAVRYYLDSHTIPYDTQSKVEGLVGTGGGLLIFDFVVLDNLSGIHSVIEYDGIHHYRPISKDNEALVSYEKRKEHDRRKDEWCMHNRIPILRIPYLDFDRVSDLISEFLQNHLSTEVHQ